LCFDKLTQQIISAAEDEARKVAEAPNLLPPPKRRRRKPLKLFIPASLSALEYGNSSVNENNNLNISTTASMSEDNLPSSHPMSPSFVSHSQSQASPSSTSSRHSIDSAPPSPVNTVDSSTILPTIPSITALLSNPQFQSFKAKISAFHSAILNIDGVWRKKHEKQWRIERQEVRDRLAHVTMIVNNMKTEIDKKELSGTLSETENDRYLYFTRLRDDYHRRMDELDMNIHFPDPTERKYKLRLNAAEERITIGVEDLALERVSGQIKLSSKNGKILLEISDVVATINLYHLSLGGKGTRLYGSFVRPERVSLALTIKKILIPINYLSKRNNGPGHWVVDRAAAIFDIQVVKHVKGSASVPDSLIHWIIKTQIPKIILSSFDDLIPDEIGPLLSKVDQKFSLEGAFNIECDFTNNVWESSLESNTPEAELARKLINSGSSSPVTPALFYSRMLLLNNIIQACKLYKQNLPSCSLYHFANYIRHYSTCIDKDAQVLWTKLLTEWQLTLNSLEGSDSLWFFKFIESVASLDDKPLKFHFGLKKIDIEISITQAAKFYLDWTIKTVKKQIEEIKQKKEERRKRAMLGNNNGNNNNKSLQSLHVPNKSSLSLSQPSTPLSAASSMDSNSPSVGSRIIIDEDKNPVNPHEVIGEKVSDFIANPSDQKAAAIDQTATNLLNVKHNVRPRSLSTPAPQTPLSINNNTESESNTTENSIRIDAAESNESTGEDSTENSADSENELARILVAAEEWQQTVNTYLVTALDVIKQVSLIVNGQLTGGPEEAALTSTNKFDAQAKLSFNDILTSLAMPPLKLTIGAMEVIKHSNTSTPAIKIVTRVNPVYGFLETLTMLVDWKDPMIAHTYRFEFHTGILNLFPTFQQPLIQPSASAPTSATPPAVNLSLARVAVEGPIKPLLEWDKYLKVIESTNIIRASGTKNESTENKENNNDQNKQEQERKDKESLSLLMNKNNGVEYEAILMPYLMSKRHEMKVTVKLQLAVRQHEVKKKSKSNLLTNLLTGNTHEHNNEQQNHSRTPSLSVEDKNMPPLSAADEYAAAVAKTPTPHGSAALTTMDQSSGVTHKVPELTLPPSPSNSTAPSSEAIPVDISQPVATSISLLSAETVAAGSTVAIAAAEDQMAEKLSLYKHVRLEIHTPNNNNSNSSNQHKRSASTASTLVSHGEDVVTNVGQVEPVAELKVERDANDNIEPEEICFDLSFRATLFEIITDGLQLVTQ